MSTLFLSAMSMTNMIFIIVATVVTIFVIAVIIGSILHKSRVKNGEVTELTAEPDEFEVKSEQAATFDKSDDRSAAPSDDASKAVSNSAEYCRWCRDCQPVVKRTSEQQNLVDKYFIVKNVETSNKVLLVVGIVAIIVGIILAGVYFVTGHEKTALIVIGAILIVVSVIMFMLYNKSFHRTTPPRFDFT